MTTEEIIAILRANPAAALEAVERAKIAGPRQNDFHTSPTWNLTHRPAIHGRSQVGFAALPLTNLHRRHGDLPDDEFIRQQDQKLIDEGWVLV